MTSTAPTPVEEIPAPARERHAEVLLWLGALAMLVLLVRVLGHPWPTHFAPDVRLPDSLSYLRVAHRGPFNLRFYADERPLLYPLFLWLLGRSSSLTVVAQTVAYGAAFLWLCATALRTLRSRAVAVVAVVAFVALAAQGRMALWNTLVLTETLSLTLAVLSIATWWRAAVEPTTRRIAWAWAWTVLWLLIRDSNMLVALAVIVPAGLIAGWRASDPRVRRALLAGAGVAVLASVYALGAQQVSHRGDDPFADVIGVRVLPNPDLTRYFARHGMPLDDALRAQTGRTAFEGDRPFANAPELARYRKWARGEGSRWFAISLLARFPDWYDVLHDELPVLLDDPHVPAAYDTYRVSHRMPEPVPNQLGGPQTRRGLVVWTIVAVVGIAVAAFDRKRRGVAFFAAVGLLSAFVDVYVSFLGDAIETTRHAFGGIARLDVMLLVCIAIGFDSAATWASATTRPRPTPSAG